MRRDRLRRLASSSQRAKRECRRLSCRGGAEREEEDARDRYTPVVMIRADALLDRLFPPDPGRLRLMAAARATVAGLASFALVVLVGTVAQVPVVDRVLGFAIALFLAATVRDSGARDKLITIAAGALAAMATTSAAALLVASPLAEALLMPALMFVITLAAARGARFGSAGLVSLIAFLIAMVSKAAPDTLPLRLLIIGAAAAIAALVRCMLMPERPETELERLDHAIGAGLRQVLATIGSAVSAGAWTATTRARLARQVDRFDEIVLLAQARAAALGLRRQASRGWNWMQLLEIELATERVARIALDDLGDAAERPALLEQIGSIANSSSAATQPVASCKLGGALDMLGHVLLPGAEGQPDHPVTGPAAAPGGGMRPALQAAAAAGLAIFLSELLLPERWYWAAFAAFVMFQGTRSRGESLAKGVAFVAGTSAGLVVGVLLATLFASHELLSLAAVVVAVFLAFQAYMAAYGVMVFWITVILGLMFGMLGFFTFDVLLLRLQESAIGVASGALVASLMLVRREESVTGEAARTFLQALRALLDRAAGVLVEGKPAAGLAGDILEIQQRFSDFRTAARSQLSAFTLMRNDRLRRNVTVFGAAEQWAREVATLALDGARIKDSALARIAAQAAEHADSVIARLTGAESKLPAAAPSLNDVVPVGFDDQERRAVRLLLRVDAALTRIALSSETGEKRVAEGRLPQPAPG